MSTFLYSGLISGVGLKEHITTVCIKQNQIGGYAVLWRSLTVQSVDIIHTEVALPTSHVEGPGETIAWASCSGAVTQ